ncbi:hypothetical protein CXB34_07255 [Pseudomonas amygdali pv. morsprunorum]|nr:hypothetical protein CXB34_07255 [Pseudomonas amygdali pv. morsprunorum]
MLIIAPTLRVVAQLRSVTQSVTNCIPTRSIGTIVISRFSVRRVHRSHAPRGSAAQICDAERHELHTNAEHWHDSHLKIFCPQGSSLPRSAW